MAIKKQSIIKSAIGKITGAVNNGITAWKNLPGNIKQGMEEKKDFNNKTEKEADKIYMKNNPQLADKNGNFSKIGPMSSREQVNTYSNIINKVRQVRSKQK